MNSLKGHIKVVEVNGDLSLVSVALTNDIMVKTIIIDTPKTVSYLKPEHPVKVLFKETEVILGKDVPHEISVQNQITGTIQQIETGTLLSKITLKSDAGNITSIISTDALKALNLKEDSVIKVMVKFNEIMLSE